MEMRTSKIQGQTTVFVVSSRGGVVTGISKGTMRQFEINSQGKGICWYEDRMKPNA